MIERELKDHLQEGLKKLRMSGASVELYENGTQTCAYLGDLGDDLGKYNENSIFRVGCLAKVLIAIQIMILHQEKCLHINAAIIEYLPKLNSIVPQGFENVTIKMLLAHTSGLGVGFLSDTDIYSVLSKTTDNQVFVSKPGKIFSYSSFGYEILGELIKEVRGVPWYEDLNSNVFRKLDIHCKQIPGTKTIYAPKGKVLSSNFLDNKSREVALSPSNGGGLALSTKDLIKIAKELLPASTNDKLGILSEDSKNLLAKEITFPPTSHRTYSGFSLGFLHYRDGSFGFNGNGNGNHSFIRILPHRNIAFAMGTNFHSAFLLYEYLFSKVAGIEQKDYPRENSSLMGKFSKNLEIEHITGYYRSAGLEIDILKTGEIFEVVHRNGSGYLGSGIISVYENQNLKVQYKNAGLKEYKILSDGNHVYLVDDIWMYRRYRRFPLEEIRYE